MHKLFRSNTKILLAMSTWSQVQAEVLQLQVQVQIKYLTSVLKYSSSKTHKYKSENHQTSLNCIKFWHNSFEEVQWTNR